MPWLESAMSKRIEQRVLNQLARFTSHENLVQRAVAMASSISSIVLCVAAIYMFLAIDPKRLVFRHQLIAFLIFFDLLKAIILLIFPSHVVNHPLAYFDNRFCQVVGFFTATAIEGADFAILAFAIHTFLLVFRPSLNVKTGRFDRIEGGLYIYRYYTYSLCFVIPLVLASLPYIGKGYSSFVCWCYLPQKPVWYRLVLSWVPRWCIVIVIFGVYGVIYYYVLREFRTLGGVFSTMHRQNSKWRPPALARDKPTFFSLVRFFMSSMAGYVLPKFVLPNDRDTFEQHLAASPHEQIDLDEARGPHDGSMAPPGQNSGGDIQAANLDAFLRRQKAIEKQMKSIFVYPFAYIFVWLFPFILQCSQFNYEEHSRPVVWLNYMGAFMQPFNGVVDLLVFFYRERPWRHTIARSFEREHAARLSHVALHNLSGDTASFDGEPKSSPFVDTTQYSRWRRTLSRMRFPFMRLPTESTAVRIEQAALEQTQQPQADGDFGVLQGMHDFSGLLLGAVIENDFRQKLHNFSFGARRLSVAPSRHYSAGDPNDHLRSMSVGGSKSMSTARGSVARSDDDMDILEFLRRGPN